MALSDYTTPADVRAVLGVSDNELEDSIMELDVYSFNLNSELRGVHSTFMTKHAEVKAVEEATRTDSQKEFMEATLLFSTYAVAKQLTSSLPMFAPKDIADSKALAGRFSDSPYRDTAKKVCEGYDLNRGRLQAALTVLGTGAGSVPKRTLFAVSSPDTDRVVE